MPERRRVKQSQTLEERLVQRGKDYLQQAQMLRPGPLRDELIRKSRQSDVALHINDWLRSPGLQRPK